MTIWQKLLSLFGADYVYLVAGDTQLRVHRAYLRSGIYVMRSTTKKGNLSMLPKASMANTPYELSVVLSASHHGQLLSVYWTPLTTKMRAWYNMLPDSDVVTISHSANPARSPTTPQSLS